MSQQCGNCKWWDRDNTRTVNTIVFANCLAPIPVCVTSFVFKMAMKLTDGRDCKSYEERKDQELPEDPL